MMPLALLAVVLGAASLGLTLWGRSQKGAPFASALGRALGRRPERIEIEVLGRASVGPKQGVAVVRIGGQAMVVSVGDGGVRKLSDVAPEALRGSMGRKATPPGTKRGLPGAPGPRERRRGFQTKGSGLPAHLTVLGLSFLVSAACMAAVPAPPLLAATVPTAVQEATGPEPISMDEMQALAERLGLQSSADGSAAGDTGAGLRIDGAIGVVVFLGLMAIMPTLVLLMTSFTRVLIVLHFLRQALGTQSAPPGHLLAALALLITAFVMGPTLEQVHLEAVRPWVDGEIEQAEMLVRASGPFREFMLEQTRESDLVRFIELSGARVAPTGPDDVPLRVLISAFVTSELRTSFQIGFALFLPFVVIDVVAASILMSMGMFMLPPVMVSLPLKLLLFVLVDGWGLVVEGLVTSF